ncbi:translation initiation factor IF-2-like [Phyllostomus hastatus]|uniref:translation initiation factor IF-2-like n=1 Tax=Phyllostomus hastatus TaxID=9423 RepID=UPI001E682BCE|nr:translation initiation factor IF-2-like [Phyllostomus hastatus]
MSMFNPLLNPALRPPGPRQPGRMPGGARGGGERAPASALRPRPSPPSSPELGERGGRGRPRRPQTLVEPKDTAPGEGVGVPAAGSEAAGGRRPGHADWPEGQVLGGGELGGGSGATLQPRTAGGDRVSGKGKRCAGVGASACARQWAPTRTRAAPRSSGTSRAAGAWRSPPGSRGSALALEGAGTSAD